MKRILFPLLFIFVACSESKKTPLPNETIVPGRATIKCESLNVKEIDPKTGKINVVKILRCDSNYPGNKSLQRW